MGDFEEKLASVMNNPELMGKIMNLAQNLGEQPEAPSQNAPSVQEQNPFENIDISLLKKLSGFASQSAIDPKKQNLLCALSPYLSPWRIAKLERAMRAAKMAGLATSLLGR